MRPETRLQALRATGALVLMGASCSPTPAPPTAPMTPATSSSSPSSNANSNSNSNPGQTTTPARAVTCDEALDAAFAHNDGGAGRELSAEARRCCVDQLTRLEKEMRSGSSKSPDHKHRFECCDHVDDGKAGFGIACTPWGPPVPPPMARRLFSIMVVDATG